MKAGDTAYLVESNRFVHEVEILRCNGELYIVCFKDNGVGLYFKAYHLEKSLQEDHFVNLEGDCEADEAEVLLIKNNYKMFEDLE